MERDTIVFFFSLFLKSDFKVTTETLSRSNGARLKARCRRERGGEMESEGGG